jgi:hypothetical protein
LLALQEKAAVQTNSFESAAVLLYYGSDGITRAGNRQAHSLALQEKERVVAGQHRPRKQFD